MGSSTIYSTGLAQALVYPSYPLRCDFLTTPRL